MDAENKAQRTAAGRPSKVRTSLCNVICGALSNIQANDPTSHPIDLATLPFSMFARYLATFKKSVSRRGRNKQSITVSEEIVTVMLGVSSFDSADKSRNAYALKIISFLM